MSLSCPPPMARRSPHAPVVECRTRCPAPPVRGRAQRTRNAILRAAVTLLSQNPAASLGEIADAANVARSTLHRYFPERTGLIEALHTFAEGEINAAIMRAKLDEGTAAEALVRLCHEYFDHWDTITWVYMESLKQPSDSCGADDQIDPGHDLIDRAGPCRRHNRS